MDWENWRDKLIIGLMLLLVSGGSGWCGWVTWQLATAPSQEAVQSLKETLRELKEDRIAQEDKLTGVIQRNTEAITELRVELARLAPENPRKP